MSIRSTVGKILVGASLAVVAVGITFAGGTPPPGGNGGTGIDTYTFSVEGYGVTSISGSQRYTVITTVDFKSNLASHCSSTKSADNMSTGEVRASCSFNFEPGAAKLNANTSHTWKYLDTNGQWHIWNATSSVSR